LSTLRTQNIHTVSITPSPVPSAGIGILATSAIPAGTTIAFVPRRSLLNLSTLPTFAPSLPRSQKASTHALLTLAILSSPSPWISTFPSSFPTHPLLWPATQQSLLPSSAIRLLSDQQTRLTTDLAAARELTDIDDEASFTTAWLCVNTRTLHFPVGGMTLCPFIDYFNHSSSSPRACAVTLDARGYTVTTTCRIEKGEEVFVTYGSHSGDFCLVEYGFVPSEKEGDYLQLDAWMEFTDEQEGRLKGMGYWGRYVLDREGFCYRAKTAGR
ncbi:SET domain-containing protein, partial [Wilcoxina mikolae CBS 423.85]